MERTSRLGPSQPQTEQQAAPRGADRRGPSSPAGDPAVVSCVSFGVPFRLHIGVPALREAVLAVLPYATAFVDDLASDVELFSLLGPAADPGLGSDSGLAQAPGYRSLAGTEVTAESADPEPVLEQLGRDLMVHVANFAPDRVFVHAGVVGWRGRAVVLPGPSFAGKTTLTAALVRAGATYYSDEYAVLDEAGSIHPYARDLQMREPGRPEQRAMAVSELHGTAGSAPLRAAAVIFAQYRAGAIWAPLPVSPGMAVLEMLRHTIPVQRTPARVMATLAATIADAAVWQSERGDAAETARALLGSIH